MTHSHGGVFDVNCAASEIDRVLTDCITSASLHLFLLLNSFAHSVYQARPVYLMLPTDRVYSKIPRARLDKPLHSNPKPNDPHTEEFVLREIQKLVEGAGSEVVILVDACVIRHDVMDETWDLIERTGFPVYSAPMGKSAVPEDYERYGGVRRLRVVLIEVHTDILWVDLCWIYLSPRNQREGRKSEACYIDWFSQI